MFAHQVMMPGGMSVMLKVLLIVAVIFVVRELRRRDDRAGGAGPAEDAVAVALLEDVRVTLDRLEERMANIETLLPADGRKDGGA